MLKTLILSSVIFIALISDIFAEELTTKTLREDLQAYYLDGVMHNEELFVTVYDPLTNNLNLWSASGGEVKIANGINGYEHPSITVIDGKIAVAYFDSAALSYKLWIDKSGNLQAEEDEFLTVALFTQSSTPVNRNISLIEFKGKALLVYPDLVTRALKVWYDDDSDFVADPEEVNRVGLHSGSNPNAAIWNDKLTISYLDKEYSATPRGLILVSTSMSVWHDKNEDLDSSLDETVTIETSDKIMGENSMTVYDGHLAITYLIETEGKLKLWNDKDGDFEPAATEIQFLDHFTQSYYPSIFVYNDNLAIACKHWAYPESQVNLWFDDGDGEIASTEMLALKSDTEGDYGNLLRLIRHKDSFKMAYTTANTGGLTSDLLIAEPVQDETTGVVSLNTNDTNASGAARKKSSGKKCIITENSSSCYFIVIAFLCLTLALGKKLKGMGNENQGSCRNLRFYRTFSRYLGGINSQEQ
ncbi:MAG: hypothetical protein V3V74_07230 [Nitrosomonadaceae bacterium]